MVKLSERQVGLEKHEFIRALLGVARHAPSSHNTQPWKVKIQKNQLVIGYAPNRQLTVGDPTKRELFISLGCFIETLVLAGKDMGYEATYAFKGSSPDNVALLTFEKIGTSREEFWLPLIKHRRSNRRLYQAKAISSKHLAELEVLSDETAKLRLFTELKDIAALTKATYDATYHAMSNPAFRAELASWVRNNWTRQPDGMPAYTQGIPGPVSLVAKVVIKKNKKVAKDQAKKDSKRVEHSAAIGLICVDKETPAAWIEAGRLYQKACLTAEANHIHTSAISAAVIVPETVSRIKKKLSIHNEPIVLLRFGFVKKTVKPTPRLSVDQLLKD